MESKRVYFDRYEQAGLLSRHFGRLKTLRNANGIVEGYSGCIEGFAMNIWCRAESSQELAENIYAIIDSHREYDYHDNPGVTSEIAGKKFFNN